MSRREPSRGYKFIGALYAFFMIAVIATAVVLLYRQHKNTLHPPTTITAKAPTLPHLSATDKQTLTFVLGQPFPNLGTAYQAIFTTPSNVPSGPPEADYLTTQPESAILASVTALCKQYNFTLNRTTTGDDIVTPTKSYVVKTVQCYDADYSWSFEVESAAAFGYGEYTGAGALQNANTINGHVPPSAVTAQAATENWLNVRSYGPPVSNCKQAGVCDQVTSSPIVRP
jgi:hypothetical protein